MIVSKPTYIVAELPDDAAEWVRAVREKFEPAIVHMPQEITLAGSSGVGPITKGQLLESVSFEVVLAVRDVTNFSFRFLGIGNFLGTDIFFAKPTREAFDELHNALRASDIKFEDTPHPYNPHCSLKGFTSLRVGQREELEALEVPSGEFKIKYISIYEMDGMKPTKLWSSGG